MAGGSERTEGHRVRPVGLITLLTDFGTSDGYVGAMKGAILTVEPGLRCVDIAHDISPQRVDEAAFVLGTAAPWFPPGTVHLAVVDPGVGSSRRALVAYARSHFFVAPDNGVLSMVLRGCRPEVRSITNRAYMAREISSTFHGRDIFAPVAAHLARGVPLQEFGPVVSDWCRLESPRVRRLRSGRVVGRVVHVDRFGNLVTNLRPEDVEPLAEGRAFLRIGDARVHRLSSCYSEMGAGEVGALFGSSGLLEVSVSHGSAADELSAGVGSEVSIEFCNGGGRKPLKGRVHHKPSPKTRRGSDARRHI